MQGNCPHYHMNGRVVMGEISLEAYFEGMSSQLLSEVLDLIIHKAIQEDMALS